MTAQQKRFDKLHSNITLSGTSTARVQAAVSHLRSFVRADKVLGAGLKRDLFLQGSYAQSTQIRPESGDEFDVDVVLPLRAEFVQKCGGPPQRILDVVLHRLSEDPYYKGRLERKNRCVRIHYEGDFHVDVTPCLDHEGHLAAPAKHENEWTPTDPEGLMAWLEKQNAESNGRFKRATKFLKLWVRRSLPKGHRPPSVALVVFAARHQPAAARRQTDDRYLLKTKRDAGDGAYMADLFQIMLSCVQGKSGKIQVPNPTNEREDLARDWASADYESFCKQLRHAAFISRRAYEEEDDERSTADWQELFGEDFPTNNPG